MKIPILLSTFLTGLFFCCSNPGYQDPGKKIADSSDTLRTIPCDTSVLPKYTAFFTKNAPVIDGKPDEKLWSEIPKSDRFRDLIYGTDTRYDTRAALCWDDSFLYVAYWIEEPYLQASLTARDAPVYRDNDVELFVAGEDAYYEFEINSFGTIYEVFFIWESAYESRGYSSLPEFDRNREGVRAFHGVGFKPHPRGPRIGFWNWDLKGLKSAVSIQGTLNDDRDTDIGWSVELALPWEELDVLKRQIPPGDGEIWPMDFSRFNQRKAGDRDSGGWAWSPHGVWDSHVPECFTRVRFIREIVE